MFGIGRLIRGAVNLGGKAVRGTAKLASWTVQAAGAVAAGATEIVGNAAGAAVGCVSERLGSAVKGAAKTIANAERLPGKLLGTGVEAVAGVATGVASIVVGDDEGADAAKDSFQDAVFGTEDFVSEAVDTAKLTFDTITARTLFQKAKSKYYALEEENKRRFEELNDERVKICDKISGEVDRINADKEKVKDAFARFVKVASAISDWRIASYDTTESYVCTSVIPAPIKTKHEVFQDVDFDNDPIWNTLKGTITIGFLTESQIKDAEVTIENQGKAAKLKWAEDLADNDQLKRVFESVAFVRESFDTFLDFYGSVIDELSYAITLLSRAQDRMDPFYFDESGRINLYFMPKRHVLALMAADKISRILCEMAKRRYVTEADGKNSVVEGDENLVRDYRREDFEQIKRNLAA